MERQNRFLGWPIKIDSGRDGRRTVGSSWNISPLFKTQKGVRGETQGPSCHLEKQGNVVPASRIITHQISGNTYAGHFHISIICLTIININMVTLKQKGSSQLSLHYSVKRFPLKNISIQYLNFSAYFCMFPVQT